MKDKLYLYNILRNIETIENHLKNINQKEFFKSVLVQDAISKRLEEIGENAKKISKEFKKKNSAIPIEEYVNIRNFLTHVYHMLNVDRLWKIVKEELPVLKKQIEKIISEIK